MALMSTSGMTRTKMAYPAYGPKEAQSTSENVVLTLFWASKRALVWSDGSPQPDTNTLRIEGSGIDVFHAWGTWSNVLHIHRIWTDVFHALEILHAEFHMICHLL
ncbi:UNVERIFIED_CONTAM: hypothetical protein K2H54_053412 [Gekko kuhli]